jgi:hypothetical protein
VQVNELFLPLESRRIPDWWRPFFNSEDVPRETLRRNKVCDDKPKLHHDSVRVFHVEHKLRSFSGWREPASEAKSAMVEANEGQRRIGPGLAGTWGVSAQTAV